MFRALCPKHVETEVVYKCLIVASCWFSLSSHFAQDARSQEPKPILYLSACHHGLRIEEMSLFFKIMKLFLSINVSLLTHSMS